MIAVVTSTIKPLGKNGGTYSFYSFEERLEQTKQTLHRLKEVGFHTICLVDNSPDMDSHRLRELLPEFRNVNVYHLQQYQFENKGINELLMLLYVKEFLPENEAIFKISGRYYPIAGFTKPDFTDFAVRPYHFSKRTGTISTRGYWVKNAELFETFLLQCLAELFAYSERIVGVKSFSRVLFKKGRGGERHINISIEFAAANILKKAGYHVKFMDTMGIEGLVAGASKKEKITE